MARLNLELLADQVHLAFMGPGGAAVALETAGAAWPATAMRGARMKGSARIRSGRNNDDAELLEARVELAGLGWV